MPPPPPPSSSSSSHPERCRPTRPLRAARRRPPQNTAATPAVPSNCAGWTGLDWPLVLQLADSALPVGGFAHSGGLEAAWQLGEVPDRTHLQTFLEASLHQAARAALPFVVEAHRQPERLDELDQLAEAWISNHVANRASRLQGRAFWTAVTHALLPDSPPAPIPGHLAPVFGTILRRLGIPLETTAGLFLFQHLRGIVSAAVRLGIVGPLEAQALQARLRPSLADWTARAATWTLDDLAQPSPLLDLWQGAQDRLYSRLFQT